MTQASKRTRRRAKPTTPPNLRFTQHEAYGDTPEPVVATPTRDWGGQLQQLRYRIQITNARSRMLWSYSWLCLNVAFPLLVIAFFVKAFTQGGLYLFLLGFLLIYLLTRRR